MALPALFSFSEIPTHFELSMATHSLQYPEDRSERNVHVWNHAHSQQKEALVIWTKPVVSEDLFWTCSSAVLQQRNSPYSMPHISVSEHFSADLVRPFEEQLQSRLVNRLKNFTWHWRGFSSRQNSFRIRRVYASSCWSLDETRRVICENGALNTIFSWINTNRREINGTSLLMFALT